MYSRAFLGKSVFVLILLAVLAIYQIQVTSAPASLQEFGVSPSVSPQQSADSGALSTPLVTSSAAPENTAEELPEIPQGKYPDGVHTGSAEGYGGTIVVEVTVQNGSIIDIAVVEASGEDGPYLRDAKGIIPKVLEEQHTDLDGISGATTSTWGILDAVDDALAGAQEAQ